MSTKILLWTIMALSAFTANAFDKGAYYVSGMVRDSLTLEPVPFAAVTLGGKVSGTLTNENGIFELTATDESNELIVSCLGYQKKKMPIKKGRVNVYDVQLIPVVTQLQEVVVKKPKYSKKNNPAVDFAKKLRSIGSETDPRKNPYYNFDKYQLITLALNDFAGKDENSGLFKKFPFLWDHVDTSEVSGKPILTFMTKEVSATEHYRKNPESTKVQIKGVKQEGIDEIFDQQSMLAFLEDVLREVDLHNNDINILQNRFVSPLSSIAPDFYKFYLTDTVEVDKEKCIVLSFYPHNTAAFGFTGQVFVVAGDSTMFIKKVTMRTPRKINLNFINNLYISQEFDRAEDGSRLKKNDDMTIEIKVAPGTPGFYARRNVIYENHNFLRPEEEESIFSTLGKEIVETGANNRNDSFWEQARFVSLSQNERRVDNLLVKLRQVPIYYWTEKFLKIMFTGYVNTGNPSKFDYGPVNTTISHSGLEGWRFRAGGMTTANLSRRWFGRGYVAYGVKDHKWKYKAEVEYSFHDKEYHSREFPMHSLRLTSMYDVDQIGQNYLFTNMDNIFISLKRMEDLEATYRALNSLEYNLELRNNFSVMANISKVVQFSTKYMPFIDGYGQGYNKYGETLFTLQLRYAPGEKFYQTKTYRLPINMDAPIIIFTQKYANKGFLGSKYNINVTELSFQKRFWMSAFGYVDFIAKGGHVWSKSPFINLLIPNANLSYTIQPESFALMNPMEFVNDSYASWDVTYWANGAILNWIPIVKKLKFREVVAFRGLWGKLSHRNDPLYNPELLQFPTAVNVTRMTNRPYMEIAAGLDNIFKCLRIDYVWRLSYLNVPYKIDKSGLRVALHMTF